MEKEKAKDKEREEFSFIQLMDCITYYYAATMNHTDTDPSEEWKKRAGINTSRVVPEDLNELIKKAFIIQIKKFI